MTVSFTNAGMAMLLRWTAVQLGCVDPYQQKILVNFQRLLVAALLLDWREEALVPALLWLI